MPDIIVSSTIHNLMQATDAAGARSSIAAAAAVDIAPLSASDNWNNTYTVVQANSSTWENSQQTITSSNSALDLDVSQGYSALTTLTEHLTGFTISNAVSGDSGMIVVSSDGGGWTFPANIQPSIVMAGDLADIATLTNGVSSRATIGWYYDGQYNYLYVSNAIT